MYVTIRNIIISYSDLIVLLSITCIYLTFAADYAMANPQGGTVVKGNASFSRQGSRLDVNQTSHRAVIDWRSFNIAQGEHTNFNQPSTSSVALNRVRGGQLSQINGRLSANGQIFLINPNGMIFGPNAQVVVGGLVATTADLRNDDFMAGNYQFNQASANPNAIINNLGQITVKEGGAVVLAAPSVKNEGIIQARLGNVILASANTYTLDFHGDKLLSFEIEGQVMPQTGPVPNDSALVNNSGTLIADGGTVTLTAQAADAVIDRVISVDGIIQAKSIVDERGEIVLSGGHHGIVAVSGTLDASGSEAGETGGKIKVLGEKVGLFDNAQILADGNAGGGEVLIGGNFQGQGPEPNAQRTYVAKDAKISASATESGNGGRVIVWADETTQYLGDITAKGGKQDGNGGFVEVSGKRNLNFQGAISVSAPKGSTGTVLLDPNIITISEDAPQDQDSEIADGKIFFDDTFFPIDSSSEIFDFELSNDALEAVDGNIILEANEGIFVDAALNLVNQTGGESVVFRGGEFVGINADVSTNGASLTLETGLTGSGLAEDPDAVFIKNVTISTNGGAFTVNGDTSLTGNSLINTQGVTGGGITFAGSVNSDIIPASLSLRAGNGNIQFQGNVGNVHRLANVSVESANNIDMNGLFRAGDTRLNYRGFWRNNINAPLDVGRLFVSPFSRGARVFGTVAEQQDIFASIEVLGVRGDPRFTINGCIMGVPCGVPNLLSFPGNINTVDLPLEINPLTFAGLKFVSIWEQQKILQDPRDERYSNLGNEELWWEIKRETSMEQE